MKKRLLVLLLALVMIPVLIPAIAMTASAVDSTWLTDGKGHYLAPDLPLSTAYYWIDRVDMTSQYTNDTMWCTPGVGADDDGESVWKQTPVEFMGGTMGYLGSFSPFDLENKLIIFEPLYQGTAFINGGASSDHEVRLYDILSANPDAFMRPLKLDKITGGVYLRAYSVEISNVSDNVIGFPGNSEEADALMNVTLDGVKLKNSDVEQVPKTYYIPEAGPNRPGSAYPSAFYKQLLVYDDYMYFGDDIREINSVKVNGTAVADGDSISVADKDIRITTNYDSTLSAAMQKYGCTGVKAYSRWYLNGEKINVAAVAPVENGDGTATKTLSRMLNEGDVLTVESWLEVKWPNGYNDIVDEHTFTVTVEQPRFTSVNCDEEAYAGDNITLSWNTNFKPLKVRIIRYKTSSNYTTFDLEDPSAKKYEIPMIKVTDPPVKISIGAWYGMGSKDYITEDVYVDRLYGVYVKTNLIDNQYHSGEATLTLQGETKPRYSTTWTDGYHGLYDYGIVKSNAFAFSDVRPGTYTLKIFPDGFSVQTATVTVGSTDVTTKDFSMKYYCTGEISGVRDTDVTTVTLWKKNSDGTYTRTGYSDTVTGNGSYSIQMVDQATYRVVATCPGYAENITPKDLTASGSRHFVMKSEGSAPAITQQPKSVTAPKGSKATVTLKAEGNGLTYTWYFKNKGASSFSKTTSFTSNSYSVVMDATRDGRQVYCVVQDTHGNSVKSNTVTISMGNPLKITTQPQNVTAANGATAKVSFTATGDGLTYTWYFKNKGASSFSKTATFTGNSYSMKMDATRDGRQVYCVVKDKHGNSVQTNTVTLSMAANNAVKITKQPANVTVAKGETAKVSFTATGDGLTYTWYYKNKGASSFSKTTSFTSNSYSVTMDASRDGRQVYCVVKDKYGNSVQTNTVTLSMAANNAVKITKQPANVTVAKGETAKVSFSATGDGLTYTWYYKNKGASSFSKTTSFTSNSYSVAMDASRDGRQVYCEVKDQYGNSVKTNTVTLSMKTVARITTQPKSVTVAAGATAKVTLKAEGDGLTYTWYFKNKGASSFSKTTSFTSNSYSVKMDASRDGRQVYCVVKDQYGNSVKSNTVTLKMK